MDKEYLKNILPAGRIQLNTEQLLFLGRLVEFFDLLEV